MNYDTILVHDSYQNIYNIKNYDYDNSAGNATVYPVSPLRTPVVPIVQLLIENM